MSETKFTPGERRIIQFDEAQTVVIASGKTVAVFTGEDKSANAHLDVVAPELYAVLESLLPRMYNPFEPDNQSDSYKRVVAVLAKARGEAA